MFKAGPRSCQVLILVSSKSPRRHTLSSSTSRLAITPCLLQQVASPSHHRPGATNPPLPLWTRPSCQLHSWRGTHPSCQLHSWRGAHPSCQVQVALDELPPISATASVTRGSISWSLATLASASSAALTAAHAAVSAVACIAIAHLRAASHSRRSSPRPSLCALSSTRLWMRSSCPAGSFAGDRGAEFRIG